MMEPRNRIVRVNRGSVIAAHPNAILRGTSLIPRHIRIVARAARGGGGDMRRGAYVNLVLAIRRCSDGRMTAKRIGTKPARPLGDLEFSLLGEFVSIPVLGHRCAGYSSFAPTSRGQRKFIPLSPCGANSQNSVHSATFKKLRGREAQSMPCLGQTAMPGLRQVGDSRT